MKLSRWDGPDLVVSLEDDLAVVVTECVLDLDESGDAVGLEFLHLISQLKDLREKDVRLAPIASSVSVDHKAAAVYVRLSRQRSITQDVRAAVVVVGSDGHILAIRVLGEDRAAGRSSPIR